MAAAVVAVSMTTVAVTAPTAEALVVQAVAETAAVLGTAVVLISMARRAVQILVVAEEELTLNQHSQAMADQELSLFVTWHLPYLLILVDQQSLVLLALVKH
jgi:hypothetical protein